MSLHKPLSILQISLFYFTSCLILAQHTTIAFGSCGHQDHPLPIFDLIADYNPDHFIFLGDNIYGDTYSTNELRMKYNKLGSKKSYQNLKARTNILATWDDHDYGWNDSGRHYSLKEQSKEIFMDFFDEPTISVRRQRKGIYHSYAYDIDGRVLQIILLDMRTFRDNIQSYNGSHDDDNRYFYKLEYSPYESSDSTMLGIEQWQWLEDQLTKPADVRIIGTSTQFGIEYNGYESWANFPHEQQKMLDLIKKTRAEGVIFISGDVHYAELSKIEVDGLYPIFDLTSSGLSSTWHFATPNKNRIEGPIMDNHFGMITIDWTQDDPEIKMEVIDIHNNQRVEYTLYRSDLTFK